MIISDVQKIELWNFESDAPLSYADAIEDAVASKLEPHITALETELEHLGGLIFAAEQAASNGCLQWEVEEALRAYNDFLQKSS